MRIFIWVVLYLQDEDDRPEQLVHPLAVAQVGVGAGVDEQHVGQDVADRRRLEELEVGKRPDHVLPDQTAQLAVNIP